MKENNLKKLHEERDSTDDNARVADKGNLEEQKLLAAKQDDTKRTLKNWTNLSVKAGVQ